VLPLSGQVLPFPADRAGPRRAFDQVAVTHAGQTTIYPSPQALRDAVLAALGQSTPHANGVRPESLSSGNAVGRSPPPSDCTPDGGGGWRAVALTYLQLARTAFELGVVGFLAVVAAQQLHAGGWL
jgi:hypothetical protein